MIVNVSARRFASVFAATAAGLAGIHVVLQTVGFALDSRLFGLVNLFDIGVDGNVPTVYSGFAMLVCVLLLALIAHGSRLNHSIDSWYWIGLMLVFLFLSIDELAALHERLIYPLRDRFHASGALYYTWVVPYGAAALAFALAYVRFLTRLPPKTARLFVLAGSTYVAGAVGLEMVGGWYLSAQVDQHRDGIFIVLQTIEEGLEMFGIVVFLYALAEYLTVQFGSITLGLTSAPLDAHPPTALSPDAETM